MKGPYDLSMMIGNQHLKNYANIDKSVTIHHRDLQVLATELYKVYHGLAAELMQKFNIETRNVKSVFQNVKCYIYIYIFTYMHVCFFSTEHL